MVQFPLLHRVVPAQAGVIPRSTAWFCKIASSPRTSGGDPRAEKRHKYTAR